MRHLLALSLLAVVAGQAYAQTANVTLYGRLNLTYEFAADAGTFAADVARTQGVFGDGLSLWSVASQRVSGAPAGVHSSETLGAGWNSIFSIDSERTEAIVINGDRLLSAVSSDWSGPNSYAKFYAWSLRGGSKISYPSAAPSAGTPEVALDLRLTNAIRYGEPHLAAVALVGTKYLNGNFNLSIRGVRYTTEPEPQFSERYRADLPALFTEGHFGVANIEVAGWAGSSTVTGSRCRGPGTASADGACLYRHNIAPPPPPAVVAEDDPPPQVSLDTSFGGDGQVILRAADPSVPLRYWNHAVDTDERVLVVYGLGRPDGSFSAALLRLRKDGTADTTFGSNGVVVIPASGLSANPRSVTVDVHGNIVVTGETYSATTVRPFVYFHYRTSAPGAPETYGTKLVEHTIPGKENSVYFRHIREPDGAITAVGATYGAFPDVATMRPLVVQIEGPAGALRAIEYFHANFGHYATIVDPVEAGKLDSGEISGWTRTRRFFWVYPLGTAGTAVVDRFFSTNFAKSSHVYTASAAESVAIKQNKDWLFEGPVFGAILPAMGKCPGALRPVTRIYNNGVTGSPNHQTTDDPAAVADALARGGVLEGAGPAAAVYCTE